jgi:hypothetical protein
MAKAVKLDKYDVARLNRAANELSGVCRKSLDQIIEGQVKGFLYVAVKATPIAPEYVVNAGFYDSFGSFFPWPKPRKIKVVGRGFAKSGWGKAQEHFGMSSATKYIAGRGKGLNYGYVKDSDGRDDRGITIANAIPYISKLDPEEIRRKGIKYATIRGEKAIESIARRNVRRAWRKYS